MRKGGLRQSVMLCGRGLRTTHMPFFCQNICKVQILFISLQRITFERTKNYAEVRRLYQTD
jgi:hypothetical protein